MNGTKDGSMNEWQNRKVKICMEEWVERRMSEWIITRRYGENRMKKECKEGRMEEREFRWRKE